MALSDDQASLLQLLGYVYLQCARPERAAVVFAALDVMTPDQPKVLRSLALAHLRSDKPQRALDALDRLAMSGSVDAVFHLLRAQSLQRLDRAEEAAAAMQSYVHLRAT